MDLTRLAPSPTGALHLGNARTFLVNWLLARQRGWKILLRIEDIDGPRIKHGAAAQLADDLRWLGLDWDEGPVYQSSRLECYQRAIESLSSAGDAYPCVCTRKEVEQAASAPHAEQGVSFYPGTCRGKYATIEAAWQAAGRAPAIRFRVPDQTIEFVDQFAGRRQFQVARDLGDFVIAKADGTPAYQLAVVVDDAAAGVTEVVRGDDLVDSTPRQILLYRALKMGEQVPRYFHLPLVIGPDGKRLAKRHGDTRLDHYRARGVAAERVIALLARWSGIENVPASLRAVDLIDSFRIESLPRQPIVFGPGDDAFLLSSQA